MTLPYESKHVFDTKNSSFYVLKLFMFRVELFIFSGPRMKECISWWCSAALLLLLTSRRPVSAHDKEVTQVEIIRQLPFSASTYIFYHLEPWTDHTCITASGS